MGLMIEASYSVLKRGGAPAPELLSVIFTGLVHQAPERCGEAVIGVLDVLHDLAGVAVEVALQAHAIPS